MFAISDVEMAKYVDPAMIKGRSAEETLFGKIGHFLGHSRSSKDSTKLDQLMMTLIPKVMICIFLTPKLFLLVFNRINNNFRYNIRSSNMVLEPFVVAHSRKTPILAIFGPKISKLKLMRYHIH